MARTVYSGLESGLSLKTLSQPDGEVPSTRLASADQCLQMVQKAVQYDATARDAKRARLSGLVDGNPPYSRKALVDAGRGDECNVNWRIAKYFLGLAKSMLYDVFSEAETFTTIELDPYELKRTDTAEYDPDISVQQAGDWSRIITEEFYRLQIEDPNFDWTHQQAQGQCVFFGCGPIHFADELDWRPISHESKALIVPEIARSNTNLWEWSGLLNDMSPDQLYARIANGDVATSRGWDVAETRRTIMDAHPLTRQGITYQNWSWHQAQLKNGSLGYADQSKRCRLCHFYFREFPDEGEDEGRITEAIINLDGMAGDGGEFKYLFWGPKKYETWRNVIHPMYWDHDLNGLHYSVNGLGLEMYAALEYLNRLYCRQADDAFAPKMFFKPTTASERERMSIAQIGRYAILPAALELVQQHVQPLLQDGIAMSREIQGLVSSNLSQFRPNIIGKQQGNPVTARQIDYEASEQAKMGKTQLARIYEQYDWVYDEQYRRATNPDLTASVRGGKQALQFKKWCKERGVPEWALRKTKSVKATRVVGQGSAFMRQQALEFLLGIMAMIPSEQGRSNLINDVIASRAGQSKVERYNPKPQQLAPDEAAQTSEAMQQVSGMKTGVPPVPVPTQNPMIFARVFIQASQGALQSLQQGGDPNEALSFLNLSVPAIAYHLQRLSIDPTRKNQMKEMEAQLKELDQARQQLEAAIEKQREQMAQQQAEMHRVQSGIDPETQIGMAKVGAKERVDMAKLQVNAQTKATKQQIDAALKAQQQRFDQAMAEQAAAFEMKLEDIKAANGIIIDRTKAAAKPASNGGSK